MTQGKTAETNRGHEYTAVVTCHDYNVNPGHYNINDVALYPGLCRNANAKPTQMRNLPENCARNYRGGSRNYRVLFSQNQSLGF